jgi:hypothetical protein
VDGALEADQKEGGEFAGIRAWASKSAAEIGSAVLERLVMSLTIGIDNSAA